jgi:hypothetical protein
MIASIKSWMLATIWIGGAGAGIVAAGAAAALAAAGGAGAAVISVFWQALSANNAARIEYPGIN